MARRRLRSRETPPVVLGAELAATAEAEQRRLDEGEPGASPLEGVRYRIQNRALAMLRPQAMPADEAIAALCDQYAARDEAERAVWRRAIPSDDLYTLLEFAHWAALFAIRETSPQWIARGLTAVSMVEAERVDWRDVIVALGVLSYAASRIETDPAANVAAAMALAEPATAELMRRFRRPSAEDRSLASWGYQEVETEAGIGFIQGTGRRRKKSRCDLLSIATQIAEHLATDRYRVSSIEEGRMPDVWLEQRNNRAYEAAMESFRRGISIDAELKRTPGVKAGTQHFVVFLSEMKTAEAAQRLLEIARKKKPSFFCKVELAAGPVFCLIVARSFVEGVESYETPESLSRFAGPVQEILDRGTAAR